MCVGVNERCHEIGRELITAEAMRAHCILRMFETTPHEKFETSKHCMYVLQARVYVWGNSLPLPSPLTKLMFVFFPLIV